MPDMRSFAAVAGGAAIGGVLRFALTALVVARVGAAFAPAATLGINVSGSFLIGVAIETLRSADGASPLWRLFVATGILGGYTTFSTFSFDVLSLWEAAPGAGPVLYVALSVGLGVAAAVAGVGAARALAH